MQRAKQNRKRNTRNIYYMDMYVQENHIENKIAVRDPWRQKVSSSRTVYTITPKIGTLPGEIFPKKRENGG